MNPQSEMPLIEEPPNVVSDNKVEDEIVVYGEMEQDQESLKSPHRAQELIKQKAESLI